MDFKQTLPAALHQQVTEAFPARLPRLAPAGRNQVSLDKRWRLVLGPSCGSLTRLAADHWRGLMGKTFGQTLSATSTSNAPAVRVDVKADAGGSPEAYRLVVARDGVGITANSDEGAMRALFHLGWRMLSHGGPLLDLGRFERSPRWSLRITGPLLHRMHDTPRDYLELPVPYLLNMARYGYNAVYLYMDWFDYVSPAVAGPLARPGWRGRVAELQKAAAYLASFGIRLLFHVNTPMLPADHRQFRAHPAMRGAQSFQENHYCLCSSSPRVLDMYRDSAKQLFREAPGLVGAVLIVGGECFCHCYTRPFPRVKGRTNCPRCRRRAPQDVIAGAVNAFIAGARTANPDARVLVWPYSAFSWGDLDAQKGLLERLDRRATSLVTFEKDDWLSIDGTRSYVFDYAISRLGPSPRFQALNAAAGRRGLARCAKTESSVSIELFNVPRIPVMQRWAQRFERLAAAGLDGLHTSWRFQGFTAQRTDEIVDYFNWEPRPNVNRLLDGLARRDFGPAAAGHVVAAWRHFSAAFALFPYGGGVTGFPYFRGPFYLGSAHPFVFDLTAPLNLSDRFWAIDPSHEEMKFDSAALANHRSPRFFLDLTWTQPFGAVTMAKRLARSERGWSSGLERLRRAGLEIPGRQRNAWRSEWDVALIIACMFRTACHLVAFQRLRTELIEKPGTRRRLESMCGRALTLLRAELTNSETALSAAERDDSLGYGATYGRAFDADLIREKIAHTRAQIEVAVPAFFANYSFHILGRADTIEPLPSRPARDGAMR